MFIKNDCAAPRAMQLKGNPTVTLLALIAVFLLALALSLHTLSFTGGGTVLQYTQSSGHHIIYVHYVNSGSSVTSTNYAPHACVYSN